MDRSYFKDGVYKFALAATMGVVFAGLILSSAVPATSKRTSKRAATLSNLKQIALGNIMYAEDYDETVVLADGWIDSLMPYIKNEQILTDPQIYNYRNPQPKYGLAMFEPVAGAHIPDVLNTDKVPLAFQSDLFYRSAAGDLTTMPVPPRDEKTNAVAFLDGHAKQFPPTWPESPILLIIKP